MSTRVVPSTRHSLPIARDIRPDGSLEIYQFVPPHATPALMGVVVAALAARLIGLFLLILSSCIALPWLVRRRSEPQARLPAVISLSTRVGMFSWTLGCFEFSSYVVRRYLMSPVDDWNWLLPGTNAGLLQVLMFGSHLVAAVVILILGSLQFFKPIRRKSGSLAQMLL